MAFKLKSGNKTNFKNMGSSPAKQTKTYPKGYTKKDIAFLKEQKEDVVRREDLDAKGKAIYDANQAKKNKKKTKTREDYLNEGFSQVEADQMVKEGGVTGYDTQEEINKGRGRKVKKKTPAKQKTKILKAENIKVLGAYFTLYCIGLIVNGYVDAPFGDITKDKDHSLFGKNTCPISG